MPVARRSDPWTSWAAARSIEDLTTKQKAVLQVLYAVGPATDEQIADGYRRMFGGMIMQSDSGLRTRRDELVTRGLVVDTGEYGTTRFGNTAILWDVAP